MWHGLCVWMRGLHRDAGLVRDLPAVASVQDGTAALGPEQDHGGARAVVGVQEGAVDASDHHLLPDVHAAQAAPRHLQMAQQISHNAGVTDQTPCRNLLLSCHAFKGNGKARRPGTRGR